MEKVLVPIDKRLYDVMCLTWKDYDPDEISDDMLADDISSMLINYLDQEDMSGGLNPEASEALKNYLHVLCAEIREANKGILFREEQECDKKSG